MDAHQFVWVCTVRVFRHDFALKDPIAFLSGVNYLSPLPPYIASKHERRLPLSKLMRAVTVMVMVTVMVVVVVVVVAASEWRWCAHPTKVTIMITARNQCVQNQC
jgi:hypothetical protein